MKLIMENWRKFVKEEIEHDLGDGFATEDLIEWIGGYTMADDPDDPPHPDDEDLGKIKGLKDKFNNHEEDISIDDEVDYYGPDTVDEVHEHWAAASKNNKIAAIAEKEFELLPKLVAYKEARGKEDEQNTPKLARDIVETLGQILEKLIQSTRESDI